MNAKIQITGYSRSYIVNGVRFYSQPLNYKLMGLYASLKKELKEVELPQAGKPKYYSIGTVKKPKTFFLVDIKSAYLSCLKNRNLISDSLHKAINDLDKIDRLKLLGMLATKTYVLSLTTKKVLERRYNEKFGNVFFTLCEDVGKVMEECAKDSKYFFYWVDGIAVTAKDVDRVSTILKRNKFKFSVSECAVLIYELRGNQLAVSFENTRTGKVCKTFFIPTE